jgi:NhaP-type Na+/H+ or K+/H+ antiporter
MDDIWRVLRDPRISTTLALAALVVAGFLLLVLGWHGTSATLFVALQLPWVVSGSFAGIAVIGAGLALLMTHLDRAEAASERAELAELQREVLRLLATAAGRARA